MAKLKGNFSTNKPNSQECAYYGRKLSDIRCDNIRTSAKYVVIGSDRDDEIYFGEALKAGEEMLQERVELSVLYDTDEGDERNIEIDLEDILVFARRYCNGIYERIARDVNPEGTP